MNRVVHPEYLDSLSSEDAGAKANRRELRLFNAYLGTASWFVRSLIPQLTPDDVVMEVGAGEGQLLGRLLVEAEKTQTVCSGWTALDRSPVFSGPAPLEFIEGDLLKYGNYAGKSIILGNMILHQFQDEDLTALGAVWNEHARLLVFQEPLRNRLIHALCRIATLPMSQVSRHDAPVSIQAGFVADELAQILKLCPERWRWHASSTVRGAYRLIAQRV